MSEIHDVTYKRLTTLPIDDWGGRVHELCVESIDIPHLKNLNADEEIIALWWKRSFDFARNYGVSDWTHPEIGPYLAIRHECFGERPDPGKEEEKREQARERKRRQRRREKGETT